MKQAFWDGFCKQADATTGDGSKGFSAVGKGNYNSQGQQNEAMGTIDTGAKDSHELLDRDRTARDFSIFNQGPELEDENGTHIRY